MKNRYMKCQSKVARTSSPRFGQRERTAGPGPPPGSSSSASEPGAGRRPSPLVLRMGKKGTTKVTAKDIAKFGDGGIEALMKDLIKAANTGNQEIMEMAAGKLHSLADQNHHEHAAALFSMGAIPALVRVIDKGTAEGQSHAAGALYAICKGKPTHQAAVVAAGAPRGLLRRPKSSASCPSFSGARSRRRHISTRCSCTKLRQANEF